MFNNDMKKPDFCRLPALLTLLLITMLVVPCMLYSQPTTTLAENNTDAKGLKQGFWRKMDKDGKILYEGQFKDNLPYGEFRYFYPDGKNRTISQISDDGNTIKTVSYFSNGFKMAEGAYIRTQKEGDWKYYDENGVLISSEFYAGGKKEGLVANYYEDGKMLEEKHFKNDVQVGPWKQYFTDGTVKTNAIYVNGKIEGGATFYYPDGKVMARGEYVHNFKNGTWTFFKDDGKMEREDIYNNGSLTKSIYYDQKLEEEQEKK